MVNLLLSGSTNPLNINGTFIPNGSNYKSETLPLFYTIEYDAGRWTIYEEGETSLFYRDNVSVVGAYTNDAGSGSVVVTEIATPTQTDVTKTSGTAEIRTSYNYPDKDVLNLIPEQSFLTNDDLKGI